MLEAKIVAYAGWQHCLELVNAQLRMVITLEVGPRILFYGRNGGRNFMANFPDQIGRNGGNQWLSYGGHRLWYAPETLERTYYPDNRNVDYRFDGTSLTLLCPDETSRGIGKQITITPERDSAAVRIAHTLTNIGLWEIELAVWCITVMAPGGTLVIPNEPYQPHGGGKGETFDPARPLVFWPYTNVADPRLSYDQDAIRLRQDDSITGKLKIGVLNKQGRVTYELGNEKFIKTYPYIEHAPYPDYGCNSEFFTMPGFLEIESLSPMVRLPVGAKTTHEEVWNLE